MNANIGSKMQKVQPEEGKSANIVSENIQRMKDLFPDVFTEGNVNFDVLRQLLGDASVLDEGEEKYGMNWHGKKKARQIALTPSSGTLLPCPDESVEWGTTKNLFIEGDNLEVLKLLQKSYANKVKMIYIDPPYNTGGEFIYPDRFQDNLDTYLKYSGQVDDEGSKLSSLTEATGRYHTRWLNMIFPRLTLARNLLHQEGVILVSIDDGELPRLRELMDSIFGEENFISAFVWQGGRKNDARRLTVVHDYIVVYVKNDSVLKEKEIKWREKKDGLESIYTKVEEIKDKCNGNYEEASRILSEWFKTLPEGVPEKEHSHYKKVDAKGLYYGDNISSPNYRANLIFDWKGYKPPENGWRYNKEAMENLDREGLLLYPKSRDARIQYKRYLHHTEEWAPSTIFYKDRRAASKSLTKLMGANVFDFPKDVNVISRLVKIFTKESDLVLDFFAGSGTTGHAVFEANLEDGANRRFILVQLPEPLNEDNKQHITALEFCDANNLRRNIAELTKQRLRLAAQEEKNSERVSSIDVGFKVLQLSASCLRLWNPDRNDMEESLLAHEEHLQEGRVEGDILYELLLKRGIDLAVPIKNREISGKTIYSIGYGVLFACLDESITNAQVEDVGKGIVNWFRELEPSSNTHVFFRDSAFRDDVSKTNMAAILEQNGISHVRSL